MSEERDAQAQAQDEREGRGTELLQKEIEKHMRTLYPRIWCLTHQSYYFVLEGCSACRIEAQMRKEIERIVR